MNKVKRAWWQRRLTFRVGRLRAARQRGDIVRARRWARSVEHAKRVLGLSPAVRNPTPRANERGIDVSSYDGNIDWRRVRAAGVTYAFCKVSEGADWLDPSWSRGRVDAMRLAGVRVGVYHFLRPTANRSGAVEARYFMQEARRAGYGRAYDLAPVIDFEITGLASTAKTFKYVRECVDEIKRLTNNTPPILYTGKYFWEAATGDSLDNLGCPLWLAAYVKDPVRYVPDAWKRDQWAIWQHTDKGAVDGVPVKNVDQNIARHLPTLKGN